jgi:NADH-quinone oxidoreductase subunit E
MNDRSYKLSVNLKSAIKHWVDKFPRHQAQSAVLMALRLVQNETGYLQDQHLDAVAAYLKMPPIQVYEVAEFYSMLRREPGGRFVLKICQGISCHLNGATALLDHAQGKLKVGLNELSEDGLFSVEETECLGACCDAPCMLVNDAAYHRRMNGAKVDELIAQLIEGESA